MRAFGLKSVMRATLAEDSIAQMMTDLYLNIKKPLSEKTLFHWHTLLMQHDRFVENFGSYRSFSETMEIISGPDYSKKIHFQAPPYEQVKQEMHTFLKWFKANEKSNLGGITFAGIAHLWFECIHPFEDGNGRLGRAIAELALHKGLANELPILLSQTILKNRKQYYKKLGLVSKTLEITA